MAGNTKLMGFLPGNAVQIERWGKTIAVGLTKESMINLRGAVTELPTKPPKQQHGDVGFKVRYDERVGRVLLDMDIRAVETLVSFISASDNSSSTCERDHRDHDAWIHPLEEAVQAHKDYHNIQGEPGVQDSH